MERDRKRAEVELRRSDALAEERLHLSDEWYRIYRFDPRLGMPRWEERLRRVHPEDRGRLQGTIERAIRESSDYNVEFRILLPDGMIKWVQTVGHPVLSATGELVQFVGSSMDVTERKAADFGQPEEVARTVAFLASGDASYITGVEINVTGGLGQI